MPLCALNGRLFRITANFMAVGQSLEKNRKNRIPATVKEEVKQQAPNYCAPSLNLILKAGLILEGGVGGRFALFRVRAQSGRVFF